MSQNVRQLLSIGHLLVPASAECKNKWRNLRTVFMRKIKPSPSGSGAKKKAYYLAEAMQFCLPFVSSAPHISSSFYRKFTRGS
ncbi:hypothetical protein J6590_042620 [Homalodisca vitripennis]|nr:hypothetical protein J6590_042620 [Homalodisca vitripennis]